ncbi:MAG: (Fe-S)-binding protein [Planctomycetota bacterium]
MSAATTVVGAGAGVGPHAEAPLARALREQLSSRLAECVHCGFCLPACPTYRELGTEMDSPRGRIHLVRALSDGRITPTADVQRHLDGCLDCRACVTACPSGVDYGTIIEDARGLMEPSRAPTRRWWVRALRRVAFRWLLPHRRRLALVAGALRLWQRSGLESAVRALGLVTLAPRRLQQMERIAPRIDGRAYSLDAPPRLPASPPRRGRVALFSGCIMDHTMAGVHHATARLLARNGYDVVRVDAQTCCGALHVHNGDAPTARMLAARNVDAFARARVDAVVVNSSGCGAQLAEYPHLLAGTPREAFARELTARCEDLTSFLVRTGLRPLPPPVPGARSLVVAWDAPCHLLHAQRVEQPPLELLRAVPGIRVVPLPESEWCCGSAGIYNITQPEMSQRVLARKLDQVLAVAPALDVLVTANPGCELQLRAGLVQRGSRIRVMHIAALLDLASQARLL